MPTAADDEFDQVEQHDGSKDPIRCIGSIR